MNLSYHLTVPLEIPSKNTKKETLLPVFLKSERNCKCSEQVLCKSINRDDDYQSSHWNRDMTLNKIENLREASVSPPRTESHLRLIRDTIIKDDKGVSDVEKIPGSDVKIDEVERVIRIVKEKFIEIMKKSPKPITLSTDFSEISQSYSHEVLNDKNYWQDESSLKFIQLSSNGKPDSLVSLLDIERNYCFLTECEKNKECCYVGRSDDNKPSKRTCGETVKTCRFRSPIILPHSEKYRVYSYLEIDQNHFKLNNLGKSNKIGKWGKCSDEIFKEIQVERILPKYYPENQEGELEEKLMTDNEICHRGSDCIMTNRLDNTDQLKKIEHCQFAALCRKSMRWTHCVTKLLRIIKKHPHVIIHLPSFACPYNLRYRLRRIFQSLQNIQFGRVGWLSNDDSEVFYVCPDSKNLDTISLKKIVALVRPDVNLDNLWFIQPENDCSYRECSSVCENLFSTLTTLKKLRYLTAGRQAFIIPGILDKKDIFIGCELRTAILGPCLKFQERLLKKSYVMNVLQEAGINQPPFMHVANSKSLYENLSDMILKYPIYKLWFIKIDCGFRGYQTAIFIINDSLIRNFKNKEFEADRVKELTILLHEILPSELQLEIAIYNNYDEFIQDLDLYGGILQASPNEKYHVISLGVFNEHDTAKPVLITTSEVIQFKSDIRFDIGYIIPQTKVSIRTLKRLASDVGKALLSEQYIGFFGFDVLVTRNAQNVEELLVIDVDPYYTDLLAFNDWRKLCTNDSKNHQRKTIENYAVCSGKLYNSGLSEYCGDQLISFCRTHDIYYDHKAKFGSLLYPIDADQEHFFLFSLSHDRKSAIAEFTKVLRKLCKISFEKKSNTIKTNMLQFAIELEESEFADNRIIRE